MQLISPVSLSNKHTWWLGFGLAIIYVPIRIYMNVLVVTAPVFFHKLPLWIIELCISTVFFTLWISVIELLQRYIALFLGEDYVDRFWLLNQFFTLLIAIGLATTFNWGFRILWHWMEAVWDSMSFNVLPITLNEILEQKKRANNGITIIALMAAYYLAINKRVYEKLQQVYINEERLEKESIKSHFNALKNQVSPHFLFNNFSVLTSLVETNQELSVKFINQLSKVYRYILEQSDFDSIKLGAEIEFLQTYMFLLKIRFEDKLKLEIDIPDLALSRYSIVPLTLQLLVENAVKHNQMSTDNALTIKIYVDDQYLVISNSIQPRELAEPSTKLGLKNIVDRYKLLINAPVLVTNDQKQFIVRLPLIQ